MAAPPTREPRVRIGVEHVSRAFGPVVANDDVSFAVRPRTVHAVIGENGAGKSTLMRILYGLDRPDAGHVVLSDTPVTLRGPADGLARGIGIVQQELALIPELTLLENLVLGREPRRWGMVDWAAARRRADELAREVGVTLDWSAPAATVPVGVQQQLEIMRLLYRGADVLILDEPTAALAPAQVTELLRLMRDLRESGRTIVFITHKLDEVLAVADEVTALRRGRVVATLDAGETDRTRLAELVVGERIEQGGYVPPAAIGDVRLDVSDLAYRDGAGRERLRGVSLSVRAGEIVGVAAVAGNGQDELVDCVVGLRPVDGGRITVAGAEVTHSRVDRRRAAGLAYISADRKGEGLAVEASLTDNVLAGFHRGPVASYGPVGWLGRRAVRAFVDEVLDQFGVVRANAGLSARFLSGGNQQRVAVGRELTHGPAVLVAAQPTRGVDIRGIGIIHDHLRECRDAGSAVLMVSEDLDELQTISDRIVVLSGGNVAGELPAGADRAEIGRLMLGREPGKRDAA